MRREVFVARTRKEALRICMPGLERKYRAYVEWGQNDPMPEGDALDLAINDLIEDRFLIGSPEEVTESIVDLARQTGIKHLIMSMHWPGMDAMRLFAEEVMPQVRAAV